MSRQIFVNLPVKNLQKSIDFFTKLGFEFNPQFTDEKATCMIIGEESFIMLLVEDFFKTFTNKEISNASKSTEVLIAISAESKAAVDNMVNKAISAGGKKSNDPMDHGWMYGWSFQDLDGHQWEVLYMDATAIPQESGVSENTN